MCQKWHYYSNLSISSLDNFHKPPSKSCKGMKSKIPKNSPGTCFICNGFAINESQLLNDILFKEKCIWNRLLYFVIHRKREKCLILSTFLCIFLKIPIYCYKKDHNIEICFHVMTLYVVKLICLDFNGYLMKKMFLKNNYDKRKVLNIKHFSFELAVSHPFSVGKLWIGTVLV